MGTRSHTPHPHDPLPIRALTYGYRRALFVFPAAFRRRFALDLAATFADDVRAVYQERGLAAMPRFLLRTGLDLVSQGVAERLPTSSLNRPGGSSTRPPSPASTRSLRAHFDALLQDVGFAWRALRRQPAMSAIIVLTLGLGIGAVTTIFTALDSIVLRPLPFSEPERLVALWQGSKEAPLQGTVSAVDLEDWRQMSSSFENIAGARGWTATLTGVDQPESLTGSLVSHEMLATLGARPLLGRDFTPEDDTPGATAVVILTHALWQRQFGGDPAVIGRQIELNDSSWQVIGVVDESFRMPLRSRTEILTPMAIDLASRSRGSRNLSPVVARLRPGVDLEHANVDMDRISDALAVDYPNSNYEVLGWAEPLHRAAIGDTTSRLYLLMGAVAFVLLIATANVANLLVARASARGTEIAVRSALGAARGRLTRQLLTESIVLALLGGLAALAVGWVGLRALTAVAPGDIPRLDAVTMNGRVLGFTALVTMATGLLFGVAPALHAVRSGLSAAIRAGRGTTGGSGRSLRRGLAIAQLAIVLPLLIGAGLLITSLTQLLTEETGFEADGVLSARVRLGQRYEGTDPQERFFSTILERIQALPGVDEAAAVFLLPFSGGNVSSSFRIHDRPEPALGEEPSASIQSVSHQYFDLLRLPIVAGRGFDASDTPDSEPVAVINESTARLYWPDESPVGRMFRSGVSLDDQESPSERRIVGVVADSRHRSLKRSPEPSIYMPARQFATQSMYVLLRTSGDPDALAQPLCAAVSELDPNVVLYRVRAFDELITDSVAEDRFATLLLTSFAIVALLLGAVGIYGVIGFNVSERTPEIGVRMALGANRTSVQSLVLRETLLVLLAGLVPGLLASFWLSGAIQSLLHGVSATDATTFVGMTLVLATMAFVASIVPAMRASHVDPVLALRSE